MNTQPTRVVVIDEQQMFAEIIQHLINAEPDLGVIGTMTSDEHLPIFLDDHGADVILLDYDIDGDAALIAKRIRAEQPNTQVVMLMGSPSGASTREALAAGCLGVVSKDRGAADLLNAIRSAARGQSVAAISNLDAIFGEQLESVDREVIGLTTRQMEILELMAEGHSTDALAAQLFVSRNTIRSHVHQILTKLGARSKLEAVAAARKNGMID